MSYNIDTWKLKRLDDLRIPRKAFFEHPRADWHPSESWPADGMLRLSGGESVEIVGQLVDGILHVESIDCCGEFSGTFMNWILEPALKQSTGKLEAACVWEGGDEINRLIVTDGAVEWQEIEL